MVRSITSQPISFSRLRACEGEMSWSIRTKSARPVLVPARALAASRAATAPWRAMRRSSVLPLLFGGGRFLRVVGRVFRLTLHKAPQLLALAGAEVGRRIETGALLRERGHHLEAQRLGQFAQFVQRCFEFGVGYLRELDGGDDCALRGDFDFFGHSERILPAGARANSKANPTKESWAAHPSGSTPTPYSLVLHPKHVWLAFLV